MPSTFLVFAEYDVDGGGPPNLACQIVESQDSAAAEETSRIIQKPFIERVVGVCEVSVWRESQPLLEQIVQSEEGGEFYPLKLLLTEVASAAYAQGLKGRRPKEKSPWAQ